MASYVRELEELYDEGEDQAGSSNEYDEEDDDEEEDPEDFEEGGNSIDDQMDRLFGNFVEPFSRHDDL